MAMGMPTVVVVEPMQMREGAVAGVVRRRKAAPGMALGPATAQALAIRATEDIVMVEILTQAAMVAVAVEDRQRALVPAVPEPVVVLVLALARQVVVGTNMRMQMLMVMVEARELVRTAAAVAAREVAAVMLVHTLKLSLSM